MTHNYELINECIICLDSNDTNNPVLSLTSFNKQCKCNSYIHKQCLLKWYTYNAICPVCRISINTPTQANILPLYNTSEDIARHRNRCNLTMCFNCCCYIFLCMIIGIFLNLNHIKYHSHK
jgi:hypothetical protein